MSRRLIVCCDGTWNVPDEVHDGVAAPTNVAKLALALATDAASDQVLHYEPGVGTLPDERLAGGAFGYGLSRAIRSCYRFLVDTYEDGDEIFLFGFSRGAYTARSLAGLIRNSGLLRRGADGRVADDTLDEAFALYRDRTSHSHPSAVASQLFRKMHAIGDRQEIAFIGVWDTVGALGIPDDLPGWSAISRVLPGWERDWGFHDTQLSSSVRRACHALAIDEERAPFKPTLWTAADPATEVHQAWFAGAHGDVGGGSPDAALSDIALRWMIDAAELTLSPAPATRPDYAGPIADSRHGPWELLHPYRRLRELDLATPAPGQAVASSAARRRAERIDGYHPDRLDACVEAFGTTPVTETDPGDRPPVSPT